MKKKYTIFGHTGFLGKNLTEYLKKKGHKVFLPSKKKYIFKKNLENVIYCIGTDDVLNNPLKAIDSNLKILCKVIEKNNFKSFLFISSTRVYLGNKKTKENSFIKIDSNNSTFFFNILKLASENFCLSKKNKKIKVVRISNLYGRYFKKQIYLLPTLLRQAQNIDTTIIRINKHSKKNYLDVDCAIPQILKIIDKSKFRIYNIASNKLYSIKFIIDNLQKKSKFKVIYENQKIKYDEPRINIDRVKREFKFKPKDKFRNFLLNNNY